MSLTSTDLARIFACGGDNAHALIFAEWADAGRPDGRRMVHAIRELIATGADSAVLGRLIEIMALWTVEAEEARRLARYPRKRGAKERWGYEGPVEPRLAEGEWLRLRWQVLERDSHTCRYCSARDETMCADHVVPLSRGGTNDSSNLVACCMPCNSSKKDKLVGEWGGRV